MRLASFGAAGFSRTSAAMQQATITVVRAWQAELEAVLPRRGIWPLFFASQHGHVLPCV